MSVTELNREPEATYRKLDVNGPLNADDALNSEIGDQIDYLDPRWLALSEAALYLETIQSTDADDTTASGSASISFSGGNLILSTGTTSGSQAKLLRRGGFNSQRTSRDWSKPMAAVFPARVRANSDVTQYLSTGDIEGGNEGIGFKVNNSDLEGVVHNGTSETTTTLISGFSTGKQNLRIDYNGSEVAFLVNSSQQGTISSGLPSGTVDDFKYYVVSIENSAASDKTLEVNSYSVVQLP